MLRHSAGVKEREKAAAQLKPPVCMWPGVERSARRKVFVFCCEDGREELACSRVFVSAVMEVKIREKRSARDIRRALRSWTFCRPVMKRVGQVGQAITTEAVDIASRRGWRAVGKEKEGSIVARLERVR